MRTLLVTIGFIGLALTTGYACDSDDAGCKDDFDCDSALVCKASSGTCEPFVCKVDGDCDPGKSCDDNVCK